MNFEFKESYGFEDLIEIIRILRSPDGCPWDKEQTHSSVRANFLEEAYEVCEAIDNNNSELLKEELGDVLLQIVFHSQIESEADSFDINDVIDGICKKMIVRHPHVFSDVKADTSEKVLENWDKIKMETKNQKNYSESMKSICKALPALTRSQKVQKKAKKAGFDWDNVDDAMKKITEETNELKEAIAENDSEHSAEELGDLLFAVVNVARFIGADSEECLNKACDKFITRFSAVEEEAQKRQIDLEKAKLSELDSLWDQAKIKLSQK